MCCPFDTTRAASPFPLSRENKTKQSELATGSCALVTSGLKRDRCYTGLADAV